MLFRSHDPACIENETMLNPDSVLAIAGDVEGRKTEEARVAVGVVEERVPDSDRVCVWDYGVGRG